MSLHFKFATFLIATLAIALSNTAHAQKWGDLTAKFVLDGTAPSRKKSKPKRIRTYAVSTKNLFVEDVVVGKGGELANAVIYLRRKA